MASEGSAPRERAADDAGAVLVLVAAGLGAILVMVALVLDLGGARRDRAADQVAADAMALAAAASLASGELSAVPACEAAWDYLVVNLPTAASAPVPSCTPFAGPCVASTARTVDVTIGAYAITLTHPVPAGHALLAGQPTSNLDGAPCHRIGVRVQQDRANLLASGSVSLDVDAVGRFIPGIGDVDAPLVLLADHECGVLTVNGTSSLAVSTATGAPGYIAIDSDGSECQNPSKVILDVNGQGTITADEVTMYALADGDATSAYSSGLITPQPTPASAPVSRNGMDWRYNCDPSAGCPYAGPPHIDEMVAAWGGTGAPLPAGTFTRWTTSGRSCSPTGNTVLPAGNWYIDCGSGGLTTNGSLTFQGGNIVSDGPITATGSGGLRVNCVDVNPSDNVAPGTCGGDGSTPAPGVLYLRSGDLVDNGDLELRQTTVYLATGKVTINGTKKVYWTAPRDPTYRFDDLLVWTESTSLVKITGNSNLYLEGTFFAPNASVELAGSTGGQALGAQIFANKAVLTGGATLALSPREDRMLSIGKGRPLLVR